MGDLPDVPKMTWLIYGVTGYIAGNLCQLPTVSSGSMGCHIIPSPIV